jgi:arylsulfate sulfotransferase
MPREYTFTGIVFAVICATNTLQAALPVTLEQSIASPAPVGTVVRWNAFADAGDSATIWYRFRSREVGSDFHTIVDYGPHNYLDWTEMDHEGTYEIEVVAWNKTTGETSGGLARFTMTSRLDGSGSAILSPTQHPLVFLYSAPGCPTDSTMRVVFQSKQGLVQSTPFKKCRPDVSMNFYIAGMRAETEYSVHHIIATSLASTSEGASRVTTASGPPVTVSTGSISIPSPAYTLLQERSEPSRTGVLLQSTLFVSPVATDLDGNVIWSYVGDGTVLTRTVPGGYFLGYKQGSATDPSEQLVREFDLAGITVAETNAARVSEQLNAMGMYSINAFHHEAIALPGGKFLVLANTERILTDVQGPGPRDVIGDTIIVLDSDLQVVWAWDAFDHLDVGRLATIGETCQIYPGCAPYYLAADANDWLHGNSLELTPDGNILFSARSQDWLIKINYANGTGAGEVIWRLGKDGDFQLTSDDPSPWFSHQHDAELHVVDGRLLLSLLDNGNVRATEDVAAHSRGQVLEIDEANRKATLVLNADLGAYSYALGYAERLPGGNYHFDLGWIQDDPLGGHNTSRAIEMDPSGKVVYALTANSPTYRSIRMRDLYTP